MTGAVCFSALVMIKSNIPDTNALRQVLAREKERLTNNEIKRRAFAGMKEKQGSTNSFLLDSSKG